MWSDRREKQFDPHAVVAATKGMWRDNRRRLLAALVDDQALLYVQGRGEVLRNADVEHVFRQDSTFQYLCGADSMGAALLIDLRDGHTTLFVPQPDEQHGIWHGLIQSPATLLALYDVDEVRYSAELEAVLTRLRATHERIYLRDTDTLPANTLLYDVSDRTSLAEALALVRAVKSPAELQLMQYAADVSSAAHVTVMRQCRPGLYEYQLESVFNGFTSYWGLRHAAYPAIVGSGPNSAVLHYSANARQIGANDLLLIDAGGEFHCYASDITRTYPASGKFSAEQRVIYGIVLQAQQRAIDALRPNEQWSHIVDVALRALLTGLREHGFVRGELDVLIEHRVAYVFMPHGLGHLAGLDVHDVSIYPELLVPGTVLTIEPGLYFNASAIAQGLADAKTAPYLIKEKIDQFMAFGGVRIEDILVITETGARSLSHVPKEIDEIEALMAQ